MTDPDSGIVPPHDPSDFDESPIELLEDDETIPPRPEEELADLERSDPDPR